MQGRVHAYEGYSMAEVTFPTRVLGLLGCNTLIVTNAAGGIRTTYPQGSLVAISDHINLTGTNAAARPQRPRFAIPRRRPALLRHVHRLLPAPARARPRRSRRQNIPLTEGVYLAVLGPSFETPAEIRAFRTLGADLVGMSTVHEVIVARHMGLEVLGLSLVTNMAAGVVVPSSAAAPPCRARSSPPQSPPATGKSIGVRTAGSTPPSSMRATFACPSNSSRVGSALVTK
jgi:purine-nucleoside phosphorylase